MEIEFEVIDDGTRGCADVYAMYAKYKNKKGSTKQLFARLYKIDNSIVWQHPWKKKPFRIIPTDSMDVAINYVKDHITDYLKAKYS